MLQARAVLIYYLLNSNGAPLAHCSISILCGGIVCSHGAAFPIPSVIPSTLIAGLKIEGEISCLTSPRSCRVLGAARFVLGFSLH